MLNLLSGWQIVWHLELVDQHPIVKVGARMGIRAAAAAAVARFRAGVWVWVWPGLAAKQQPPISLSGGGLPAGAEPSELRRSLHSASVERWQGELRPVAVDLRAMTKAWDGIPGPHGSRREGALVCSECVKLEPAVAITVLDPRRVPNKIKRSLREALFCQGAVVAISRLLAQPDRCCRAHKCRACNTWGRGVGERKREVKCKDTTLVALLSGRRPLQLPAMQWQEEFCRT